MKIIVAQLGARMHYAVPDILNGYGYLSNFYTDIVSNTGWVRALNLVSDSLLPGALRRLKARKLPQNLISRTSTFPIFGLRYAYKRSKALTLSNNTSADLWAGKTFNKLILNTNLNNIDGLYLYNSAALELMTYAKSHGITCILEQTIAPKEIEIELLRQEHERFPGWQEPLENDEYLDSFIERERNEAILADYIICGSEFVRDSLVTTGVSQEKCYVVPYGVSVTNNYQDRTFSTNRPLRVLVAGEVGLRKGSPYVLEVAKRLIGKVQIRMVGTINILPDAKKELEKYVELSGIIPRDRMAKQYQWADVFFLPSVCEGSATVTYEALVAGLPVICTYNTGSIVQNGYNGFVHDQGDVDGMVQTLFKLSEDKSLLKSIYSNIQVSSKNATTEAYKDRLINTIDTFIFG